MYFSCCINSALGQGNYCLKEGKLLGSESAECRFSGACAFRRFRVAFGTPVTCGGMARQSSKWQYGSFPRITGPL